MAHVDLCYAIYATIYLIILYFCFLLSSSMISAISLRSITGDLNTSTSSVHEGGGLERFNQWDSISLKHASTLLCVFSIAWKRNLNRQSITDCWYQTYIQSPWINVQLITYTLPLCSSIPCCPHHFFHPDCDSTYYTGQNNIVSYQ